jgi:hypothetical protein
MSPRWRLTVMAADIGASVEVEPHETVHDVIVKALDCVLGDGACADGAPTPDLCELFFNDVALDPDKRLDETLLGDGAVLTLSLPF